MNRIRFSVPHNWQHDLVDGIDLSCVDEFYGKLDVDILGGGRSSNICPPVSKKIAQKEVLKIHNRGIKFNYLLNSTCLDNQELSHSMHRRLIRFLDWLGDLSVDSVTVSMPYVLGFVKKNYPNFKICVSTMAQVDSPDKAKFWEDFGADKITLYEVNVNRNFDLIRKIRKAVNCQLQLIANNGCLYNCPFTVYHGLLCSHASQDGHILKGFIIDFYRIMCSYVRIKEPVNFIRADWIRPEDLFYYEDLGVNCIKIVNRGMSTDTIKNIVKAYTQRKYEGNLLDLLPSPSKNINFKKHNLRYLFKFFFHPRLVNIFKLIRIKKIFRENGVYIDNKRLDGFLASLQDKDCDSRLCSDCGWCEKISDEVVKINAQEINQAITENERLLDEFISGRLFKYP